MCKIMNVFGQNGRENLWMFFQAVIAVYLLILSVIDIRWKKVSVRSLLILLVIAVLCQVLCSKGELRMMVAGGLCGGVFLFLSWFTQESFGYGDSILILILGILSGGWNLLWILFAAFLIASVYGGIMIARKKYTRKNSFPFIPFLTIAYLVCMIGVFYLKIYEKIRERKYSGRDVLPYSFLLNSIFSAHHDHFLLS